MAHEKKGATDAAVAGAVRSWEDEAAKRLKATPEMEVPEPEAAQAEGQRVLDQLRVIAGQGAAAVLVDPTHDAPWEPVVATLIGHSAAACGRPEARVLVVPGETGKTRLQLAIEGAVNTYRRLRGTILGPNPTAEDQARAVAIFADRPMPTSKSGWETELKLLHAEVTDPDRALPDEVKTMARPLADAVTQMEAAPALQSKRATKDVWAWSPTVRPSSLALHLAIDKLGRWAFALGDDTQLAAIVAAINGPAAASPANKTPTPPDNPPPAPPTPPDNPPPAPPPESTKPADK